jgi:uncharacterized damage-inducible protein DinB
MKMRTMPVSAVDLLRRMHRHRAWVNGNMLAAAANLPEEKLRAEFPIGQGSIWKTLVHLYAAEYVWLQALEGEEDPLLPGDLPGKLPGNQQGEGGLAGLSDLRDRWAALERRWDDYFAALRPENLGELVVKKSTGYGLGRNFGTARSDVLIHVCTHAQYTVAQACNMLRQVGATDLPETMLMTLARKEAVSSSSGGGAT